MDEFGLFAFQEREFSYFPESLRPNYYFLFTGKIYVDKKKIMNGKLFRCSRFFLHFFKEFSNHVEGENKKFGKHDNREMK